MYTWSLLEWLETRCVIAIVFNFALQYAIRRVLGRPEGLQFIGTHQLLFYNDRNVLGASIRTVKKNTGTSVFVSNEIGLELNNKKTKCVCVCVCAHIYIYIYTHTHT